MFDPRSGPPAHTPGRVSEPANTYRADASA
jgi:hypothetical protein